MFKGIANNELTTQYLEKSKVPNNFKREFCGTIVSSLGMGTYIGKIDEVTNQKVIAAAMRALELGCNFFDTAVNYRRQNAERALAEALRRAILSGSVQRENVFISTKGGFVPFENETQADIKKVFEEEYVSKGLVKKSDLVAECHCMAPAFIENQIEKSRKNLGLETIDLYYLHNPETQLEELPARIFYERLFETFCTLENAVKRGTIAQYGIATWSGLRDEASAPTSIQLEKCMEVAKKAAESVGFSENHFKAIQLPLNLGMPEAATLKTQSVNNTMLTALDAAAALDLSVATSVPLLQGRLCHNLPDFVVERFPEHYSQAHCALSFAKSFDAVDVVITGMKEISHVEHNLELFKHRLLTRAEQEALFTILM